MGGLACAFPAYHGTRSPQRNPGELSPHKRLPPREDAGPLHLSDGFAAIPLTAARTVIWGTHRQSRRGQWSACHVPEQRNHPG